MAEAGLRVIRPQEGYQMDFLASAADIVIGGGAAGVGKTFSLLLEYLRHKDVKGFGAVIFRRTSPQIRAEGGLWDTSVSLYPGAGGKPKESTLEWIFAKSKLKFSHLEHEKNLIDWQGSQIPMLGFDELTHFSRKMFFYLLTRNRSACGVKPYARATTNPDPDSWVAEFISWWINQETGFPIPERNGVLRYLVVDGDNDIWADTIEEALDLGSHVINPQVEKSKGKVGPETFVKSVTFISGSIYDNQELLSVDPGYLANLNSQDEATKAALLDGNWKVKISDEDIYDYYAFLGVFDNSIEVTTGKRYITADVALDGSNKFIVGGWDGFELIDIEVLDKSDGSKVVNTIKEMAKRLRVPNMQITYDADGVGGYVQGFIPGAKAFNNGGKPLPEPVSKGMPGSEVKTPGKKIDKPNYKDLKTQCYYLSGRRVNAGGYRVSEDVASRMYDEKMTVRQRFMHERRAIKKDKMDEDGKLQIIPKKQMKTMLNGQSPDLMDMFMMREYFELVRKNNQPGTY